MSLIEPKNESKEEGLDEIRCQSCNKLIAKNNTGGLLEIKCIRCGTLNTIFERMGDRIIVTGPLGLVLYVNQAVVAASGYGMEEIVGHLPSSLWARGMPPSFFKENWEEMKVSKKSAKFKMINHKKTGEPYQVELTVSPILDPEGNIMFFFGVERDA